MKEMAVVENNGVVSDIVYCEDSREETENLKSVNPNNLAYIGGDYFEGFFYPKRFKNDWVRDGKGNWIVKERERETHITIEDIWDGETREIVGKIIRKGNEPLKRYETNESLSEVYEIVDIDKLPIKIKEKFNRDDFLNMCMISKNSLNDVTDYYFCIRVKTDISIPDTIKEKYNLNRDLSNVVRTIGIRYNKEGEFVGYYYEGGFPSLIDIFLKNDNKLKEEISGYYSSKYIIPFKCIVKDFGNRAIYVVYNQPIL